MASICPLRMAATAPCDAPTPMIETDPHEQVWKMLDEEVAQGRTARGNLADITGAITQRMQALRFGGQFARVQAEPRELLVLLFGEVELQSLPALAPSLANDDDLSRHTL